jgi:hypothetical protein
MILKKLWVKFSPQRGLVAALATGFFTPTRPKAIAFGAAFPRNAPPAPQAEAAAWLLAAAACGRISPRYGGIYESLRI